MREHQIERCLRLLEPLGIERGAIDVGFSLAKEHDAYAADTLQQRSMETKQFMLFNASASRPASSWPASSIAAVAAALERRHGLRTLVCGLPQDRARIESAGLVFVDPPSVMHFSALVRRARFLMCGDGGPMHVAAAMGTAAFVLFSSTTDPRAWRPWGVPFGYRVSAGDIARISADEALAGIEEWLEGKWSG